ncbi:MAG: (2Fe-2S) ferredoxin domain-containing protein [Synergistaceae bacterium]|nr:(2Fe-2S) ferredoxin domain-containing protein [Synergistaceae bacterium]MBP9957490.1 (2Fe-2S) ferredoxin domain-containing protein [Synergistaceae bacterium]
MALKSLDELRKLKEQAKAGTDARNSNETQVIVGMGTCGIAAGARTIMSAVLEEIAKRNLQGITVRQTGCIGMCQKEPLMDIVRPGEPRVTYGNLKPEDVPRIISEHLVNGRVVEDLVIAKMDN